MSDMKSADSITEVTKCGADPFLMLLLQVNGPLM